MFLVNQPVHAYQDPWNIPFETRFRELCDGARRVAYFYERPDTSTFRYRVYNMIQVLRELGSDIGAGFFGLDDREHLNRVVDAADVIVICRTKYNQHVNQMITRAKLQGKRVIFDVDDLVFNTDYAHLILRTLDQSIEANETWDHWFGWIGRMGATLRMCDAAIGTNSYLAARLNEYSGLPASVIPNFLNKEQLAISDPIYREKVQGGFKRNGYIHIGYFSGTPTHNHDFAMVAKALATIMREDSRVRLLVVGFLEMKGGLEAFAERIEFYPLHDFINLQRLMGLVEINIVPLLDNGFTNCKSELKYFEAAAVGTLTIATPIHSYASAIVNGENGFISSSSGWLDAIRNLIQRLDDYPRLAQVAHDRSIERYGWFNQLELIEQTVFGHLAKPCATLTAIGQ
ncbi:Glycosyl transferases group 1 [Dyella jiangningensis]|uniref:glycosyltransferase n=1 Tax=Dyella sp. AtDHG13 TaxID=1938897 RepID=UPI00087E829B|nr:glycosyltransferase [Dyella sp. AtDHG13]PXV57258.1 glycosyl transferase family 1 [Dyella sp. AtDHG13]SDK37308.1 Glycosyl transferases group 1 [Dyella jiangningensis]